MTRKVTVGGVAKPYILYVGKGYTGTRSAAVLLAFHGRGDTASNYIRTSRWMPLADKYGFILVAMSKPAGAWDPLGTGDAAYADAVLLQIQKDHNTNNKRLHAVGFSQGGYFVYRYGLMRASKLAAIAVQSASNPGGRPVTPARKIGVVFVIGTKDSAYTRVKQNYQSLKAARHPVKLIELPGQGHCCGAQRDKNLDIVQFFEKNPKP